MQTLKLEIEDSKLDIVLNIIKKYEIVSTNREDREDKDFINISQHTLEKIWDNQEDSIYDKYLKI